MLIALLAVLGVDLIVIVVLLAVMVSRKRWVPVWTKASFRLTNELVPVDALASERSAAPERLKRLGDDPVVVGLTTGASTVEVAERGEDRNLLRGPYG